MAPTFWLIVASALVNRLGTMVGPFLPMYLLRVRAISEPDAALLLAAGSVSAAVGAPFGGWLADRLGRRPCLGWGMAVNGASLLAIPWAPTGPWLVLALLLRTFTNEIVRPATTAAIADVVPREQHRRAFGIYRTAINLGFGIGTFTGGILATGSFDALFVIDAGTKLAAAGALLLLLPETRPASAAPLDGTAATLAPPADAPVGRFAWFCLMALLVSLMSSQLVGSLPLSLERRGGDEVTRLYGSLLALNGVLVVLLQLPTSMLVERGRLTTALAAGALLYGAGYGLVALPPALGPLAAAVLLLTLGEMLFFPLASVFTAQHAPEGARGRWFGALTMSFAAGQVLSPVLGAWVMRTHGDATLWLCSPVVGLVAAAGVLALRRGERYARAE